MTAKRRHRNCITKEIDGTEVLHLPWGAQKRARENDSLSRRFIERTMYSEHCPVKRTEGQGWKECLMIRRTSSEW